MKFHFYTDLRGEHRWRLVAENGRILADSAEGYVRRRDCETALGIIVATIADGRYDTVRDNQ